MQIKWVFLDNLYWTNKLYNVLIVPYNFINLQLIVNDLNKIKIKSKKSDVTEGSNKK